MSIGVWDTNSHKLGSIDGDAVYANGQKAGTIVNGNKIWDAQGHEVGAVVNGNKIWDAQGHEVGAVLNGNEIWDAWGHKLGSVDKNASNIQIGAAGLLLFGIAAPQPDYTPVSASGSSGEKTGAAGFFISAFMKLSIFGKIGAILGLVLGITLGASGGKIGNVIFIAPLTLLIGTGIGALFGLIFPKLSKSGKFGTLIGAVVAGVLFGIVGRNTTSNLISYAVIGIILGSIAGAIIGAIVGLIMIITGHGKISIIGLWVEDHMEGEDHIELKLENGNFEMSSPAHTDDLKGTYLIRSGSRLSFITPGDPALTYIFNIDGKTLTLTRPDSTLKFTRKESV